YKEHGYLWHFTLEEQMDYGPSIVAKFAHHERRVLEDLGQRVRGRGVGGRERGGGEDIRCTGGPRARSRRTHVGQLRARAESPTYPR
ncbi:unnamed protein product, partial [Hapterophycus canaliculatus]